MLFHDEIYILFSNYSGKVFSKQSKIKQPLIEINSCLSRV